MFGTLLALSTHTAEKALLVKDDIGRSICRKEGRIMPRGNGTGPMGMGPMSGRAAGYCGGFGVPGFVNAAPGRGMGAGFGRGFGASGAGFGGGGRGRRNMFYATGLPGWMRYGGTVPAYGYSAFYQNLDPETEKRALRNRADALQSEIDNINQRLSEMETGTVAE